MDINQKGNNMSTKIYNAYKVVGLSLSEINEALDNIQDELLNKINEISQRISQEEFKKILDLYKNEETAVVLYTLNNDIYIQFFDGYFVMIDVTDTVKDMFSSNKLIDYHYQNQSDRYFDFYDNVTDEKLQEYEKDWKERELVWDKILEKSSIPSKAGESKVLLNKDIIMEHV